MKKTKIIVALLAVIILAAAIFNFRRQMAAPAVDFRPSAAVGEVLAAEMETLLKGSASVVIIGRASDQNVQTSGGEQIQSFLTAVKQHPSIKLEPTEWLPAETGMMKSGTVTADQLSAAIEKNPKAGAVVIFAGLPPLTPALAEKIKERSLKMAAVGGYSLIMQAWLKGSALAVAVVPHAGDIPAGSPTPKTAQDWFRQEYILLSPDHPEQWPY